MSSIEQFDSDVPYGGLRLRTELAARALTFAKRHQLPYEQTDGTVPGVLFGSDDHGRHGNFHPLTYQRISNNSQWSQRLNKVHTAFKRSRARANWQWKELDCAHSSDALLMNIFCYPQLMESSLIQTILGVSPPIIPEFGFKPRTPLSNGKCDNTEIDMRLGSLLVEAKLTETNFQAATSHLISRYQDLETVFISTELPSQNGRYLHYQLIRGALAAYASGASFCVFCDARRPDLVEAWYEVIRAVRLFELRCRLKLLTWQELAYALPHDLQEFLKEKYGIFPKGSGDRSHPRIYET